MNTFLKRFASSVILIGVFCCAIFLKDPYAKFCFMLLAMFGSYFAAYEFADILKKGGKHTSPFLSGLCVMIPVNFFFLFHFLSGGKYEIYLFFCGICMLLAMPFLCWFLLLFSRNKSECMDKIFFTGNVFFIMIFPFIVMLSIYMGSKMMFLFFVLGTKIGDIGAYIVGSLSNAVTKGGNHKLIPSISPGKSWEGFFGGWIASVAFSYFVFPMISISESADTFLWHDPMFAKIVVVVLGSVLFLFGAAGDLSESSLKRICGVKDSGKIIPGIGGVLDLVDSLMLNAPLFGLFLIGLKFFTVTA